MSAVKKCRTCHHHAALEQQCRKNPPTAAVIGVSQRNEPLVIGMFPFVSSDHWCGAHDEDAELAASLARQPKANAELVVFPGSGNA